MFTSCKNRIYLRSKTQNPTLQTSGRIRGRVLPYPLSIGVMRSALCAGENTRACGSVDDDINIQRHSKSVPVLVEDQSNCILLSITENATKVILIRHEII